jgi:antitoxin component of RelBE/YafQ-DinJ toxin-antitoxin module
MKLQFDVSKPNTATIQFRIDPNTKKMLTAVKKHYGVGTGQLLKKMIQECYKSIKEEL